MEVDFFVLLEECLRSLSLLVFNFLCVSYDQTIFTFRFIHNKSCLSSSAAQIPLLVTNEFLSKRN